MRAAVVHGKNDIRMEEVPTPVPGRGEVLVKVKGSGVCATDVKILGGNGLPKSLPTILGHEVTGEIDTLGEGVNGLTRGQRVAVYPIAVCNDCFFCNSNRLSLCPNQTGLAHGVDGGFAEYVCVPERIVALGGPWGKYAPDAPQVALVLLARHRRAAGPRAYQSRSSVRRPSSCRRTVAISAGRRIGWSPTMT